MQDQFVQFFATFLKKKFCSVESRFCMEIAARILKSSVHVSVSRKISKKVRLRIK